MLMKRVSTAPLNSCPKAVSSARLNSPNSEPRVIAVTGLDDTGRAAMNDAAAKLNSPLIPFEGSELLGDRMPFSSRPDLIVVAAAPEAPVEYVERIYRWATELGILVTTVVIGEGGPGAGPSLRKMRRNADMIVHTSDEDFLPLMLEWLGRP